MDTAKSEGRVEGKEERSFEIAKSLLFAGVDLKTIMDSTGLNEEEIETLNKKVTDKKI